MKSAYQLAMERLEKAAPSISLTEDQKNEIAEVDSVYRAKIAEREVFLKDQFARRKSLEISKKRNHLRSSLHRKCVDCRKNAKVRRKSFEQVSENNRPQLLRQSGFLACRFIATPQRHVYRDRRAACLPFR